MKPRCYDCLSYNVAVKVIDPCGFEIWFCAEDWAAEQALHDKIMKMLSDAVAKPHPAIRSPEPEAATGSAGATA